MYKTALFITLLLTTACSQTYTGYYNCESTQGRPSFDAHSSQMFERSNGDFTKTFTFIDVDGKKHIIHSKTDSDYQCFKIRI